MTAGTLPPDIVKPEYTHCLAITGSFKDFVVFLHAMPNPFHRLMQRLVFGFRYATREGIEREFTVRMQQALDKDG